MPRHLPPTAMPLAPRDLWQGLRPPAQSITRLEVALCQYLGASACKLAASGRTALYVLLKGLYQAADHPTRRQVIMPAYTCPAIAKVTLDAQLYPRFIDISPDDLTYQLDQLENTINRDTLAVILVHPFGIPQRIEPVQMLAHRAGAVLIEDAAQAMGARLNRQPVGVQGDFGLFSLGPGKPLSTGGGGVLVAKDETHGDLLKRAWEGLPAPSNAASLWSSFRLGLFSLAFHPYGWWLATRIGLHRVGDHEASWGYALRGLSQAQAALGLVLLKRLDGINHQRKENARRLIGQIGELDFLHVPSPPQAGEPIYLRLPMLVKDEGRRDHLFRHLWAAGTGAGRMYQHPLPDLFPQFSTQAYPGARYVARHLLTLPTHHYMTGEDIDRIVRIFQAEPSVAQAVP